MIRNVNQVRFFVQRFKFKINKNQQKNYNNKNYKFKTKIKSCYDSYYYCK